MNNTELAEELRAMNMRLCNKAADALEAAQAEIEQWKTRAAQWRTECREMILERNAALARLAEIEKQGQLTFQEWWDSVADDYEVDDFKKMRTAWNKASKPLEALYAAAGASPEPIPALTYSSTQATMCAGCGERKHTPLRIDAMGGYVCLTCIDQKLGSLLGEFGYPDAQPIQAVELSDEDIGRIAVASQDGISPHDDTLRFARALIAAYIAAINAKGSL